jgi:DNA-binding NarL/FixJ family response regulator
MRTPNAQAIRAVHRLLDECRELGDDAVIWGNHFVVGLQELLNVDVVAAGQMAGVRSGNMSSLGLIDTGWERGFNRAGWYNGLALWMANPYYSPVMNEGYRKIISNTRPTVIAPQEVASEREWIRSEAYQGVIRAMGCDHHLGCMFRIPTGPDDSQTWVLNRGRGARKFNEREQAIVDYLAETIAPMMGGSLAGLREIRPSDLSPRLRQVLACVLEGDGDKQIAQRMDLSRHTINEYLKTIYRHFHVSGRAELMARWIKRGWGAKFAWNNEPLPIVHMDRPRP